jgi:pilus assembly protein CpaC
MPGLSSLPLIGKLFQSRSLLKNNSELLVIVTPEIVEPIQPGQKIPSLTMPLPFLPAASADTLRQPSAPPSPAQLVPATIPIEVLRPPVTTEPAAPFTGVAAPTGRGLKPAETNAPSGSPAPSGDSKP